MICTANGGAESVPSGLLWLRSRERAADGGAYFVPAGPRAPLPLVYKTPERINHAFPAPWICTSNDAGLTYRIAFPPLWSGLVRVKWIHPDQKPRAIAGPVRVVRVVRAKSNISHMCARAYVPSLFSSLFSILTLKFEFVRNHPDHPDRPSASLHLRPDRSLGPTRTTRTGPANTGIPEHGISPART